MVVPDPTTLELILFDMDGVLVDTSPSHAQAFEELWRLMQIEGPPYAQIAGRRTRDVVDEVTLAQSPTEQQLNQWVAFKQKQALEKLQDITPFPDVLPALERLHAADKVLAVGSSASKRSATVALAAISRHVPLRCVVTGDDVAQGKPAPHVFIKAMRTCGVTAQRTIIIEDSTTGLEAAAASGAWFVSVRTGLIRSGEKFLGAFGGLQQVADSLIDGTLNAAVDDAAGEAR